MRRLRHLFIVALVVLGLSGPIPGTVGSAGAQGSAGAPNQKVVVLGDSIAFGLWDLRGGYARRYADLVGADLVKIAWPGWTIADLSAALDQPWVRQAVSSADIVVFDIGANDLAALPRGLQERRLRFDRPRGGERCRRRMEEREQKDPRPHR